MSPQSFSQPSVGAESQRKALEQELSDVLDLVGPVPLVDLLFERAFDANATDIHLDAIEQGLRVRLRVDGMLHDVLRMGAAAAAPVISRIKILAGMNISERRLAQDGHLTIQMGESQRDIRVGSGPTIYGERLVCRLLTERMNFRGLGDLGLEPGQITTLTKLLLYPHGMLLSVGPVGSGKSTLMYSLLELLNQPTRSLVSIEDPVERRVEGVCQIQVEPKIEFGFAEALRAVLRQDPNTIMVGEIRDPDTANIAVRAGRTGVLVLSTMHANDAPSTIDVFKDFGIPPMFIADSVVAIVSQRLLRKVCVNCAETYVPEPASRQAAGLHPDDHRPMEWKRGRGCPECFSTGYKGRTGIFEVFTLDSEMRKAILAGEPRHNLLKMARDKGIRTLAEVGLQKVIEGITTPEELARVATLDVP
jgi:type II secretory ATPase GspE/PulE/Tfp pilus assembly ATPase PilB-like protein